MNIVTYSTRELPQISFGRMIGYYTRDFRTHNPVAAVDYLTLIHLNADLAGELGQSQSSLCHEALRELVLETQEFAQLLGDVRSDGTRIRGAIEQRLKLIGIADQETFLRTVTLQAASIADDNGRTTDAVLLYHLSEDYDNVISIVNRVLSEAIAVDIGEEKLKLQPLKPRANSQGQPKPPEGSSLSLTTVDDPADLAKNMITLYNGNALYYQKIRSASRDACGVLLRISEAKGKVETQQWAEAIDVNILLPCSEQRPHILIWSMSRLYLLFLFFPCPPTHRSLSSARTLRNLTLCSPALPALSDPFYCGPWPALVDSARFSLETMDRTALNRTLET